MRGPSRTIYPLGQTPTQIVKKQLAFSYDRSSFGLGFKDNSHPTHHLGNLRWKCGLETRLVMHARKEACQRGRCFTNGGEAINFRSLVGVSFGP